MSSTMAANLPLCRNNRSQEEENTLLEEDYLKYSETSVAIGNESVNERVIAERSEISPEAVDFQGDILFAKTGTTYVIDGVGRSDENSTSNDHQQSLSSQTAENASSKSPARAIQFLTFFNRQKDSSTDILKATSDQEEEAQQTVLRLDEVDVDKEVKNKVVSKLATCGLPLVREFRVHMLAPANNNNNSSVKGGHVASDEVQWVSDDTTSQKAILMCFPCRLTFGYSHSFVAHASNEHDIQPNSRERSVLGSHAVSCVIQKLAKAEHVLCFLEPVVGGRKSAGTTYDVIDENIVIPEVELSSPEKELANLSKSEDESIVRPYTDKEKASETHVNTEDRNDAVKDKQIRMTSEVTIAQQPISTTNGQLKDDSVAISTAALDLTSPTSRSFSTESPTKSTSEDMPSVLTQRLQKQDVLTSSERPKSLESNIDSIKEDNRKKSTPSPKYFPNGSEVSKDMADLVVYGGVSNLDPVFHMSMFQTRNSCKTLKCPKCNWHYKYRQTLEAHMKEKHQEDTSDCGFCNNNQPHPRLSRGESYACGYKPFKCEVCNYSTTTKGNLSIHMQSDKHLYNMKSLQHQQQQNGGTVSPIPPHIIAARQEQLQNLQQHMNNASKRASSTPSDHSAAKRHANSPLSRDGSSIENKDRRSPHVDKKSAMWRCDVCKYETNIARNLRIHMTSEKHAHNVSMTAREEMFKRAGYASDMSIFSRLPAQSDAGNNTETSTGMGVKDAASSADPNTPQSAAMSAMYNYYLLASMQMLNSGSEPQEMIRKMQQEQVEEQEKLAAQQQQMAMAQQYMQMLSMMGDGDRKTSSKSSMMMQQLLLQQQLNLWRQFMPQQPTETSSNNQQSPQPVESNVSIEATSKPTTFSHSHLFSCGICAVFSCNDFESLCAHVRSPRLRSSSAQLLESEWISRSGDNGFLCSLCNYSTQLKTNFSLHCKTEKHTSKLSLIAHLREGGADNEWKIKYAINGNNMQQVTCNGCQHVTNSLDKLRTHNSAESHDGTVAMCRYLDTLLKQPGRLSLSREGHNQLFCKPCGLRTKHVIEMVQHLQTQGHQTAVEKEKLLLGNKVFSLQEIILITQDDNENEGEANESIAMEQIKNTTEENSKYKTKESLLDKNNYKLNKEDESQDKQIAIGKTTYEYAESNITNIKTEAVPEKTEVNQIDNSMVNSDVEMKEEVELQCPHCSESVQDKEKFQLHLELHRIKASAESSSTTNASSSDVKCSACQVTFNKFSELQEHLESKHHSKNAPFDQQPVQHYQQLSTDQQSDDIFSDPVLLLNFLKLHPSSIKELISQPKFESTLGMITMPCHCPCCPEKIFSDKSEIFYHLKSHSDITKDEMESGNADKVESQYAGTVVENSTGNSVNADNCKAIDDNEIIKPDTAQEDSSSSMYKVNFSAICPAETKQRKSLHPENRSRTNRQKAKKWKENSSSGEEQTDHENPPQSDPNIKSMEVNSISNTCNPPEDQTKSENENKNKVESAAGSEGISISNDAPAKCFSCSKCGKEFSTVWVLKVHEKVNHDNDLTCDEVEEFAKGYSEWFWKCAKREEKNQETSKVVKPVPQKLNDIPSSSAADNEAAKPEEGKEEKSFHQMAMETLMKNYGMDAGKAGNNPAMQAGMSNMQQQMMMQLLLSQQMASGENPMQNNNINNLMQMMYGGNVQMPGQTFPANMAEMLAAMGGSPSQMMGVSPYYALALAAQQQQQQQQQMQQLLMYPSLAAQAMPFLQGGNMPDEARQQLMTMLAAGQTPNTPGMNPATIAAALQMYQQAAGTHANSKTENNEKDKPSKQPGLNSRPQFPPPLIPAHQLSPAVPKQSSDVPMKRPRTRITDDQLKVLRSHFDINTSPGDEQIADMAIRTGLPPKVIKHWFRNTLFKERQRSKDSPYNFNIPPLTASLDDQAMEVNNYNVSQVEARNDIKPLTSTQSYSPNVSQSDNGVTMTNTDSDYEITESNKTSSPSVDQTTFSSELPQNLFNKALSLMPLSKMNESFSKMNEAQIMNSTPENSNDNSRMSESSYKFDNMSYSSMNPMMHHSFNFGDSNLQDYSSSLGSNKRTPRTRFSDFQLKVLQDFFDRNAYPKDDDLDKLSQVLDLSTRVIVVWFQNARQKARKNYEMQQHQGLQKRNSASKSFSTQSMMSNYACHKGIDYPASNASSNSKSPVDFQNRSRSISPEAQSQHRTVSIEKHERKESLESIGNKAVENNMFKCKLCDQELPSMQAFQHHMQMHATMHAPYMSNIMQQYGMNYPLLQSMMAQEQIEASKENSLEDKKISPHFNSIAESASMKHVRNESELKLPYSIGGGYKSNQPSTNVVRSMLVTPPTAVSMDTSIHGKRKISVSPTLSYSSSSSAISPVSGRQQNNNKDGQRDPKRLRTTITPEQLQYLYQQYMVDSSPSRKVIEHISEIVGLTKRVVQVWFQNTRARERKGQFRSVGRITSTLGQPHPCPHCDQTLRNKADLDAHIRESHNSLAPSLPTIPPVVPKSEWNDKPSNAPLTINPSVFPTLSSLQAFKDKSERALEDEKARKKSLSDYSDEPNVKETKPNENHQFAKSKTSNSFNLTVFPTIQTSKSEFMNHQQNLSTSTSVRHYSPASPEHLSPTNSQGSSPLGSPDQGMSSKRYRTQMSSEQVWFQNARAKEKKAKLQQFPMMQDSSDLTYTTKTHCDICPNVRYSSSQDIRDHVFSQEHMARFKEVHKFEIGNNSEDYESRYNTSSPEHESFKMTSSLSTSASSEAEQRMLYASLLANKPAALFQQYAMQHMMQNQNAHDGGIADESTMQQQMDGYKAWIQQMLSSQVQQQVINDSKPATNANNNSNATSFAK